MKNNTKIILFTLTGALILFPETAHAQALFDSGTNFLNALMNLLTATWARIIAIIAIVILGFSFMRGMISWGATAAVIGGIILVFGAAAIVDSISGSL